MYVSGEQPSTGNRFRAGSFSDANTLEADAKALMDMPFHAVTICTREHSRARAQLGVRWSLLEAEHWVQ